ncbi:MAG: hypothetical protein LBT37_08795 [Lactobacillaceae bacterium]|jgi:hypothetical protein|nr:hypothetical protein [Lactobacillaceae bacterium]
MLKLIKWSGLMLGALTVVGLTQNVSADSTSAHVEQTNVQLLTPNSPTPQYELDLKVTGGIFDNDLQDDAPDTLLFGGNFEKTNSVNAKLSFDKKEAVIKFTVTPDQSANRKNIGSVTIKADGINPDNNVRKDVTINNLEDTYVPGVVYNTAGVGNDSGVAGRITWEQNGKPMLKDSINTGFLALADGLKENWKKGGAVQGGKIGFAKLLCLGGPFGDALDMILKTINGSGKDQYIEALEGIKNQINTLSGDIKNYAMIGNQVTLYTSYRAEINDFLKTMNSDLDNTKVNLPIKDLYRAIDKSHIIDPSYKTISDNDLQSVRTAARKVFSSGGIGLDGFQYGSQLDVLTQFEKFAKAATGEITTNKDNIFKQYSAYMSLKHNYNSSTFNERLAFNDQVKQVYFYYYFPITFAIAFEQYDAQGQINTANDEIARIDQLLNYKESDGMFDTKISKLQNYEVGLRFARLSTADKDNLGKTRDWFANRIKDLQRISDDDKDFLGEYEGVKAGGDVTSVTSSTTRQTFDFLKSKKLFAKGCGSEMDDPTLDPSFKDGHGHLSAEIINFKHGLIYSYWAHKYLKQNTETISNYEAAIANFANGHSGSTWSWQMSGDSKKWYATGGYVSNGTGSNFGVHDSQYNLMHGCLSADDVKMLGQSAKFGHTVFNELEEAEFKNMDGFLYAGHAKNSSVNGGFLKAPTFTASIYRLKSDGKSEEEVKAFNENWHCQKWNVTDVIHDEGKLFVLQPADVKADGCVDYTPSYNYYK